jgi:hypothetical protein
MQSINTWELDAYLATPIRPPTRSAHTYSRTSIQALTHTIHLPTTYISNMTPMLRTSLLRATRAAAFRPAARSMATAKGTLENASQAAGEAKDTNPKVLYLSSSQPSHLIPLTLLLQDPSVISSAGAVGKQFNPDGAVGQVGEKIGGVFSKVCLPSGRDGSVGEDGELTRDRTALLGASLMRRRMGLRDRWRRRLTGRRGRRRRRRGRGVVEGKLQYSLYVWNMRITEYGVRIMW